MKHFYVMSIMFVIATFFVGCSSSITALLDVKATSNKVTPGKAYTAVTSVLVDNGFDIKVANKDIGLVTTEYKKYGSVDGNPPFDYYLQVKTQIKTRPNGNVQITLTPMVKESNRINAAAFTESELRFLTEEEQKGYLNANEKTTLAGQVLFMNVVQGVAESLGLGTEDLEYNKQLKEVPSSFMKTLLK